MDGSGAGVLAVGLVLCFFGMRSLHLAVPACGFALGWLLAEAFDAQVLPALVIAVAVAVVSWVVVGLVLRTGLFFVGAVAGAVIGAKLFGLLERGDRSVVLAVLFVAAVGALAGVAAARYHDAVLVVVCALAGAALALNGLARVFPDALGFLRDPGSPTQSALVAVAWIVLAVLGWSVQRRRVVRTAG
jgi:hypothetical protein